MRMNTAKRSVLTASLCFLLLFAAGCESERQRDTRQKAEHAQMVRLVGGVAIVAGILLGVALGSVRRPGPNDKRA